jgi:AmmeMemoRadiSam system protein B
MHPPDRTVPAARWVAGFLLALLACQGMADPRPTVRPARVAGPYYPSDPAALRADVEQRLAAVRPLPGPGRLVAIVAPHGPYVSCGAVMAEAFAVLQPGQFDRVVVLAPAHHARFEGASLPDVDAFATPLGMVPLDRAAMRHLNFSTLVTMKQLRYGRGVQREPIHETEHSVEALLPFLQARLGAFRLVPVLLSDFEDATGRYNPAAVRAVAERLRALLDERTLLVVSTDFTHFGDRHRYQPFRGDVDSGVRALDRRAFEHLVALDAPGFQAYLEETGNPICGRMALNLLMHTLPDRVLGTLAAHAVAADQGGGISYAAIHYYDYGRRVRRPAPKPQEDPAAKPKAPGVHLTNIGRDPEGGGRKATDTVQAIPHVAPDPSGGVVALPPVTPDGPRVLTNRPAGQVSVEPPPVAAE